MFTDLEFIKTCLNGLRSRIEKVENWVVSFMRTNRSNWTQNDSNALDYVKNRPFYSETENITVKNAINVALERFPVFAIGDTVTVNVDGVEHSLVAYDD